MEARMIVGYARCSTEGQDVEGQIATLKAAGAERVYSEKISGVVTDRRELAKAIASLTCGELLLLEIAAIVLSKSLVFRANLSSFVTNAQSFGIFLRAR
jgi:DNA invertase Pin-like site-specific DNA recombinase